MKRKTIFLLCSLLILAGLLSACTGGAGIANSWPGLAVDEDTVYLAYNQHIYAIQLSNGTLRWRFPTETDRALSFYADPAISPDGQLVVGGYNNVIYSLNPDNGQMNWEFGGAQRKYVASPLADEKGIFAPNTDTNLYALGLDGSLRWTFKTGGEIWARPVTDPGCECLYMSSMDHRVYAINPEDGSLVWQTEELGGAIVGSPALSEEGILYVGTFGSEIIALDSRNGRVLWEAPTDGWVWSGPARAGDRLYAGDINGNFYALDASDGQEIWQLTPDQLDGSITGSPLVLEDTIYFTSESGTVFSLDSSGNVLWRQTVGGRLFAAPVLAGDMLLVAPAQADQLLFALSLDGATRWTFNPEN